MSNYRMVSRHVRYWRGAVHKWSNVYPFVGTLSSSNYNAAIAALYTLEQGVNYHPGSGGIVGGCYEIDLYNSATGGVPIDSAIYFPWATPGSWISYTSAGWDATTYTYNAVAEAALQVEWNAGLSSSGKPVKYRKWYHSVPTSSAVGTRDVSATQVTDLQNLINTQIAVIGGLGIPMGSGSRLASTSSTVLQYYGSHQMPRGRRRPPLVTASGVYRGPTIHGSPIVPVEPD